MSRTERELVRARRDAARARTQLTGTLVELQGRLKPSALLEETVEELREKAKEMAKDGIEMIKARPVAAAGVGVAILAYFFRGALWDALAAVFSRAKATDPASDEFETRTRRTPRRRHGG